MFVQGMYCVMWSVCVHVWCVLVWVYCVVWYAMGERVEWNVITFVMFVRQF